MVLGVLSCASANFNYKWYGIDPEAQKLLGPTEQQDLPISICQGTEQQQGKCAVFLVEEFERLRTDYIQLKLRLKACEEQ